MKLNWLTDFTVVNGVIGRQKQPAKSKLPVEGDIAIYKNGGIYFSEEFEKDLNERYLDLVFLSEFKEAVVPEGVEGLLIAFLEKGAGKASIKDKFNGVITFIKDTFVPSLKTKLNVDLAIVEKIELSIVLDNPIVNENGIYHFEKLIVTGKSKGQFEAKRRENVDLFPVEIIIPESDEVTEVKSIEESTPDSAEATEGADTITEIVETEV